MADADDNPARPLDVMRLREVDLIGLAGFIHGISGLDGPKCRQIAETILELFTYSIATDARTAALRNATAALAPGFPSAARALQSLADEAAP